MMRRHLASNSHRRRSWLFLYGRAQRHYSRSGGLNLRRCFAVALADTSYVALCDWHNARRHGLVCSSPALCMLRGKLRALEPGVLGA